MKRMYSCCAGMDVHKGPVYVCLLKVRDHGESAPEVRVFGTTRGRVELTKQADDLESSGVADRASHDPSLLRGRVRVVDDDYAYRRIVALRMESISCRCHVAGTHAEVLRLLSRHPEMEVAVLDYHMRGEDVASLVARIRSQRPDVTLVGHSSMERRKKFAALGVDRFLFKPFVRTDRAV